MPQFYPEQRIDGGEVLRSAWREAMDDQSVVRRGLLGLHPSHQSASRKDDHEPDNVGQVQLLPARHPQVYVAKWQPELHRSVGFGQ